MANQPGPTQNAYDGWPDAPNPDVEGQYVKEDSMDTSGENILGKATGQSASYALGEVPD